MDTQNESPLTAAALIDEMERLVVAKGFPIRRVTRAKIEDLVAQVLIDWGRIDLREDDIRLHMVRKYRVVDQKTQPIAP